MPPVGSPGLANPKQLPTSRVSFPVQLAILRAFAAVYASRPDQVVTNADVADIIKLKKDTISLANPFFAAVGLITKRDGGFVPSEEVIAYGHSHEWDEGTSFQKAAQLLENTFL